MFAIPVVHPEIAGPLQREIDKFPSDGEYLKKKLSELAEENPVLEHFIRNFAKTTKDPKGTAMCGVLVFKFLESQAAANRLELEINLG